MTRIRRGILAAAACAAVALAFVSIARQAANTTSTSDTAVIETFTLLASRFDLLLGPYSRFQWHHPGPMYFFWLAPFYVLSGLRTTGVDAGALALNLTLVAVVGWTLARRATPLLAVGAMAALLLFVWRTSEVLASPWNPHIPVVATIALLVVAADAMSGTGAALPATIALASLAAQTHVALLPFAIAVSGAAVLVAAVRLRRGAPGASATRIAVATAAVAALAWALPLVEQLTHRPGNLGLIYAYFAGGSRTGQPFGLALSASADMLAGLLRPDFYVAHGWRFVESPVRWAEALSCVQVVALGVFGARALRLRRPFDAALAWLLMFGSLVALWSATRIEDEIFDHAVFWMSGIGALNLGVLAALLAELAAARFDRFRTTASTMPIAGVFVALTLLIGVGELRANVKRSLSPGPESVAARAVADDLQQFLHDRGIERPLVRFDQDAWGMVAGVVLQLQKAGVPVAVEDDWMAMYTPAFAATGGEPIEIAIAGAAEHVRLSSRSGDRVVSSHPPLFAHVVSR